MPLRFKSLRELLGEMIGAINKNPPVPASLPKLKAPERTPAALKGAVMTNEAQTSAIDRRKAQILALQNKKSALEHAIELANKRRGTSTQYTTSA